MDALSVFSSATRTWFERAFEGPTPAQALGWPAIARGGHVLIQAPTGSGKTLAALLRALLPDQSWNDVRRFVAARRAKVNGELCLDPARRLKEGETVELLPRPAAPPQQQEAVVIRHLDEHVVVVEKPSGINTVRHPAERAWKERRKELSPTLEDVVPNAQLAPETFAAPRPATR